MNASAATIRLALSRGFDTLWIAERYGLSEAAIWNKLARTLPPSAPSGAGRLTPVTGHSSLSQRAPGASALGGSLGGVVGGLVHAKAQLREFDSGENAKLLPGVGH